MRDWPETIRDILKDGITHYISDWLRMHDLRGSTWEMANEIVNRGLTEEFLLAAYFSAKVDARNTII